MAQDDPTRKGHELHIREDGLETQELTYITTESGEIILLICPRCKFIEAHCLHVKNTWNEEQTFLNCDLCGIDGT